VDMEPVIATGRSVKRSLRRLLGHRRHRHRGAGAGSGAGSAGSEETHAARLSPSVRAMNFSACGATLRVALEVAAGSAGRTESTSEHESIDGCGLFLGLISGPQA
jgi:hypothetical protein